jgi:hypothetical protein
MDSDHPEQGEHDVSTSTDELVAALAAEANRPESLTARQAATAEAEAEFLADLDAEALTVEHAQAGDRVEVVTGTGFLTVTVDRVGGVRHGWASVTYHHDNGFSMTRRLLCSTPVSRPAIVESA